MLPRIVLMNGLSDIFPMGNSYPPDTPPFYGAQTVGDLSQINNPHARETARAIFTMERALQQRAISVSFPGDIVPMATYVDPLLIRHIVHDTFDISLESIQFLTMPHPRALTLPRAIEEDGVVFSTLQRAVARAPYIISPYAMDSQVIDLARALGCPCAQDWPYDTAWTAQKTSEVPLSEANSKAICYTRAHAIDPSWVPQGIVADSYEAAADYIVRMVHSYSRSEWVIKADLHVCGMGNIRFAYTNHTLSSTYQGKTVKQTIRTSRELLCAITATCHTHGIHISKTHPCVVERWEDFFLDLSLSVEVFIPHKSTGKPPIIINECVNLINNDGYVGSINPDPLTTRGQRFSRIPVTYWDTLGISKQKFVHSYQAAYQQGWEQQRTRALSYATIQQRAGESGHRDFDFGFVASANALLPKLCESNARRTGTWAADSIGRKVFGPDYLEQSFILTADNLCGSEVDAAFTHIHNACVEKNLLFERSSRTGAILTGHARDGARSRLLVTIVDHSMANLLHTYHALQTLVT